MLKSSSNASDSTLTHQANERPPPVRSGNQPHVYLEDYTMDYYHNPDAADRQGQSSSDMPPPPEPSGQGSANNVSSSDDSEGFRMPDPETDFSDWPEPEPLHDVLRPVPELPEELIPPSLQNWVQDVAHRMQVPLCFTAVSAFVVAGSLIGTGCGIRPKEQDDWLVVPNLWGGLVAVPGKLKSPALGAITEPLKLLEAEEESLYEYRMETYRVQKAEFDSRRKALDELMKAAAKKEATSK
jgi:hypothetical protein